MAGDSGVPLDADQGLEAYLQEGAGWDRDRRAQLEARMRRAGMLAALAVSVAVLAIAALFALLPLKSVQPYVIRVDSRSGVVDVVPAYRGEGIAEPGSAGAGGSPMPEALTRQLLTSYVSARERYAAPFAPSDYELVGAYQSAAMNQQWYALWTRSNADSPLNLYRDGRTVRVQIQSVTFLPGVGREGAGDIAQVRFVSLESANAAQVGGGELRAQWLATLQWGYGPAPTDARLRALNPLGFRVLAYRKEREVMTEPGPGEQATGESAQAGTIESVALEPAAMEKQP